MTIIVHTGKCLMSGIAAAVLVLQCVISIGAALPAGTVSTSRSDQAKADQVQLGEFESLVADIWGADNVWTPTPKVWVQYEPDLGERSAVDFETGRVQVQLLVRLEEAPENELVLTHMKQGVRNLVLGDAEDPVEMVAVLRGQSKKAAQKYSSHDLTLQSQRPSSSKDPWLLGQIRMADGRSVSYDGVADFAEEVVGKRAIRSVQVLGADGVKRKAVTVEFDLAPNHLELRARKFYPIVKANAEKYNIDPPLIMAMIHTESMFNPRARSRTPAYGLMQLVPHSGALEAYKKLYGKNTKPTSQYLYNPKNNIELGVAYFDILSNRYMRLIDDPASRTYCAVAAYNAGAANVGGAFTSRKSINMASPVINGMKPDEVYAHLVGEMEFKETREYTQKVLTRRVVYSGWQ